MSKKQANEEQDSGNTRVDTANIASSKSEGVASCLLPLNTPASKQQRAWRPWESHAAFPTQSLILTSIPGQLRRINTSWHPYGTVIHSERDQRPTVQGILDGY